jgi:hypothetical protein
MEIPIKKRVRGTPPTIMRPGEGGGGYSTLIQSDTVDPSGRSGGNTRSGRTGKKSKDLSMFIIKQESEN